jgi:hypothetical protein
MTDSGIAISSPSFSPAAASTLQAKIACEIDATPYANSRDSSSGTMVMALLLASGAVLI